MAPDKSLAAEIEAKAAKAQSGLARAYELIADQYGTWSPESGTQFSDHGAAEAVEGIRLARELLAEIAALQSRAFEDGARKGLADALAVYDAAERDLATAEAVHEQMSARVDATAGIGEIMDAVGAEEACMRCLNAEAAAQARLIEAVRAALSQLTPTTEDKGREDA